MHCKHHQRKRDDPFRRDVGQALPPRRHRIVSAHSRSAHTPKLGETPQEREERRREGLAWELETGAVHAVVQAYRQARDRGESELTAFNAAADAALASGRPLDKINDTARVLIGWAVKAKRN